MNRIASAYAYAAYTAALPPDPALPQLALALDGPRMGKVFGAALRAQQGLHVRACQIDLVKYRPQRNCTVSYILMLHDEWRDRQFEQRVAARFFAGHESEHRHARALGRATISSPVGPALLHVPSLGLLAHWLPNDAKLDALGVLHDDAALRIHCLEVVAALTGGRGRLIDHCMTLAQYVPEHRVCARVELRMQREPGAAVTTQTLYAKADSERRGATTHAVMQALYDSPAQASGRLRTPQPVQWQAGAGLQWQLAVPGLALLDVDSLVGPAASARVGEQLAALHATSVPVSRSALVETLREQPRQVAAVLGRVEPAWKPLLARLVGRLEAGALALEREPAVTLHGDLHPRNILVDGQRQSFIDLDSVRRGPAVIELGAWVADALYRAMLDGVTQRQAAPSWRAFLAGYAHGAGCAADESLLAWSTAHNLLCQRAYRCVANLKPGRYALVPALLAQADAIMHAGTLAAADSDAVHSERGQPSEAI